MNTRQVPDRCEQALEGIFSLLARAVRVYELRSLACHEYGLASGGSVDNYADDAWRTNLSTSIAARVSSRALEIKDAVYRRDGRPWYASIWRLNAAGERSWEWDFEVRPRGSGALMNCLDNYLYDLRVYPREDRLVPMFMRPTLAAAGAWDPVADRLTLDAKGQPAGTPTTMPDPEIWFWDLTVSGTSGPARRFGQLPADHDERDLDTRDAQRAAGT